MILQHNTIDAFYRSPQGALPAGAQVRLRVAVMTSGEPESVNLRTWDGTEQVYPMRPLGARITSARGYPHHFLNSPDSVCHRRH